MLLTTHYMDEAERLCDRVAIVDHGKVIALGSPAELIARLGGDHIVEFAARRRSAAASIPSPSRPRPVLSARLDGDGYALTVGEPHRAIPALLDALEDQDRPLARLTTRHVSLEDVFVALTGRHLRDDVAEEPAPASARPSTAKPPSRGPNRLRLRGEGPEGADEGGFDRPGG